jgi:uncharacterized low-complexity protein
MTSKTVVKPLALAVGTALAGTFAVTGAANADTGASPFAMTTLAAGYMLGAAEGSCGGDTGGDKVKTEGACGGDKVKAEGACGGDKKAEGDKDAKGSGDDKDKAAEGKCGEGKCGGAV